MRRTEEQSADEPLPLLEVAPVGDVVAEPSEKPVSLGRRVLQPRTLISFAIAAAILFFIFRRFDIDLAAVWQQLRAANPWLYGLAFTIWYATFILRAFRWRLMLARAGVDRAHGYPVPGIGGMVEIYLLSWFANCIAPAKLGDVYRSYLLKQDTGASFSTGFGTIVAERLIDLSVLFAMMTGTAILVFRDRVPAEAWQTLSLGLILLGVATVGLGVMWFFRDALQRRLPIRVRDHYGRLDAAIFSCLRRPAPFFGFSIVIWLTEGLRIWLVAASLQIDLSPATTLFIALMGAVLSALPFTPAGLGVVELGTGAILVQVVGLSQTSATSVIILDRLGTYWTLIIVGIILYVRRTQREHRTLA